LLIATRLLISWH